MDLGIKDKRVLVTGASRSMGRDIALAFATEGCRVTIVARNEKALKAVIEEMGGQGLGHEYYATDLMVEGAASKAVQTLIQRGGAFDIVVHNLGGTLNIKDHLAPVQQWHEVWKLNVGVAIEINNIVVPLMKTKGWGRIVHMSSTAAEHLRGAAAYGVTKAYLDAYTQSLGRKLAKDGIVVSAIKYSVMKTTGGYWDENSETNRQFREQFLKRKENLLKEHQSIGRLGEVEDIIPFVLFMTSEYARFATGSIIPVTGGGSVMGNKSLTVVIPAYNEQDNLDLAFDNVQRALEGVVDDYEIIVIDDGSQDRTALVAQARMRQDTHIKCISNDRNRGYGYSFWRGVNLARMDYVGVFPADSDMTWESFRDLVKTIGQADIISAYMTNICDRKFLRRMLSQLFVVLMNIAFGMRLKYFNGPFIGRRELLQALTIRSLGLTILAECKVRMVKQGSSFMEVPFTHIARHSGRSTALRWKSIKAVIKAVISLYKDIYWKKQYVQPVGASVQIKVK